MSDTSITILVERAQNGDAASFDTLVARYQNFAVGYAIALTGNRATGQDVAQEALLAAWQQIGTLRDGCRFGGWLRQIVFKHADRARRARRATLPLEYARDVPDPCLDPHTHVLNGERTARLQTALAALPESERAVLILYCFGDARQSDIARFLGVSTNAVKKRLERARARLRGIISMDELMELTPDAPLADPRFAELNRLLRDLTGQLKNDPQIAGAYLARWGADEGLGAQNDAWASLNLHVIVRDAYIDFFAGGRRAYARRVREPLLWVEAPQNAPPNGYYLMAWYDGEAGPYEVDWYFHPLNGKREMPGRTLVLVNKPTLPETILPLAGGFNGTEPLYNPDVPPALQARLDAQIGDEAAQEALRNRVHFFWAMWLISAKYIVRNPNEERMGFAPMLRELLRDVRRGTDNARITENAEDEAAQPTAQAKIALLRQLAAEMDSLHQALTARGVTVPALAARRALRFLGRIEAASGA